MTITKEDIYNILKLYDDMFSLNDGGFAPNDEDLITYSEAIFIVLEEQKQSKCIKV